MNIHDTAANNKHVCRINQKRYKKRIYIYIYNGERNY